MPILVKIGQKKWILQEDILVALLRISRASITECLSEGELFRTKLVEKSKTQVYIHFCVGLAGFEIINQKNALYIFLNPYIHQSTLAP
jgi:hypothetical protein